MKFILNFIIFIIFIACYKTSHEQLCIDTMNAWPEHEFCTADHMQEHVTKYCRYACNVDNCKCFSYFQEMALVRERLSLHPLPPKKKLSFPVPFSLLRSRYLCRHANVYLCRHANVSSRNVATSQITACSLTSRLL